jgi:hypothetical protein
MFRVSRPDELPEEVPHEVNLAIRFSWDIEQDVAARHDWGERPLHVLRFRREWMRPEPIVNVALIPTTGIEYTADALRRAVAREAIFRTCRGAHLGTAVVTEGLAVGDGMERLPDVPDDDLRRWVSEAMGVGEVTPYRSTIGVLAGWRFLIGELRGSAVEIAGYAPGEAWQEPFTTIIDDVTMVDRYLRSLAA